MESGGQVSTRDWSGLEDAWKLAQEYREKALDGISNAAQAFGFVGKCLLAQRNHCANQAEFDLLLAQSCSITPQEARRCMSLHERIATRQIDTADHASVRQLLLDVGLMPPPEPGRQSPPQDAPWWVRMTSKIDAKLGRMEPAERAGLRQWCEAMLQRLNR